MIQKEIQNDDHDHETQTTDHEIQDMDHETRQVLVLIQLQNQKLAQETINHDHNHNKSHDVPTQQQPITTHEQPLMMDHVRSHNPDRL